jgi:sodium/hydrogen exchanger-like protein 6/7
VSLLFCGICLKHYAYHNMSRRTQLTTKFVFSLMSQLSENFIFIYLGLSLFTSTGLEYKPLFILVTIIGICVARWCAVFPLAGLINWFIRYRAKRRGQETSAEEIPINWKIMIFWAGLRGAVGVALAEGLGGTQNGYALRATVLVVVVLTVIIFGGTTSRMLEILKIRTGVVEEIDSDDEFDIEPVPNSTGAWSRKNGKAFGHTPKPSNGGMNGTYNMDLVEGGRTRSDTATTYSTGNATGSPPFPPDLGRRNSSRGRSNAQSTAEQGLLHRDDDDSMFPGSDSEDNDLDLPPSARRSPKQRSTPDIDPSNPYPVAGARSSESADQQHSHMTARGAINSILNATSEDAGNLFNRLDESFLKPHLLLDPGGASKHHGPQGGNGHGGERS